MSPENNLNSTINRTVYPHSVPPTANLETLLIIDDSNQICSALVSGIVRACADAGKLCQIVQSGQFGFVNAMPMDFSGQPISSNGLIIYTANSCRNALPVLHLPTLSRLTIVCDIMMPNDRVVGLLGLLSELNALALPVNLLFASGEGQNRYYIEQLLNNQKAYFIEKGTPAWAMLPYALVQRSSSFKYRQIVRPDYDQGRLYHYDQRYGTNGRTTSLKPAVEPTPITQPKVKPLKTSTGLLSLLTFWRKRAAS